MEAASSLRRSVRVLVADDHALFTEALSAILGIEDRIEVVGTAGDGEEAVKLARVLAPDVIAMDIAMPIMYGIEATRRIRELDSSACIVMLTGSDSRADVNRARSAGAAAYVTKDRVASQLVREILELGSR